MSSPIDRNHAVSAARIDTAVANCIVGPSSATSSLVLKDNEMWTHLLPLKALPALVRDELRDVPRCVLVDTLDEEVGGLPLDMEQDERSHEPGNVEGGSKSLVLG